MLLVTFHTDTTANITKSFTGSGSGCEKWFGILVGGVHRGRILTTLGWEFLCGIQAATRALRAMDEVWRVGRQGYLPH